MRIERLDIGGFGRFADVGWELDPGLTVMLGANEAGKTTLLNVLRAILFGFESSRDGRTWYPSLAGGRRGGRLSLLTRAGERWVVERHGPRGGAGSLAVRAPSGNQGGQETLDRLMHGADRDLFNAIFAFGLGELQDFDTLGGDGVRGRIYGAATGLGGSSAVDLERRLREQQEAIFRPSGRLQPMNQHFTRMDELTARITELTRQPEEFEAAHRDRAAARAAADAARDRGQEHRARALRLQRVLDAAPTAAALDELEARLALTDAALDTLAPDVMEILGGRLGAAAESRARLDALDDQLAEVTIAEAGLVTDDRVLDAAEEIGAVDADRQVHAAAADRLREATSAEARHAAVVADQLVVVGGWNEARLVGLDDSIAAVEATREHERQVSRSREAASTAARAHRSAADELAAREREGTPAIDPETEHPDAMAALRQLELIRARPPAGSGLPAPMRQPLVMGGLALAALVGGIAIGVALGQPLPGAVIGVLAAVLVLVAARLASGADTVDEASLLARAGLAPDASDAEIARRLDGIAEARALRSLARGASGKLEARREEVERLAVAITAAGAALGAAERAWTDWLNEQGMPADFSPEVARQVLAAAGVARRAAAERDEQRRIAVSIERERASHDERAADLLRRLEVAPGGSIDGRLTGLVRRLEQATVDRRARQELATRRSSLLERRGPLQKAVATAETSVTDHLAATGTVDPDALRAKATAAGDRRDVQRLMREAHIGLAGVAGGPDAVDALRAELRGRELASVEAEVSAASAEATEQEAEERRLVAQVGELDAVIRGLESADELGTLRQELAVLEGRAKALAREWAVRAIAARLLAETRSHYERERQPDVVRAAEAHFERITGGRYVRIMAPPGEADVRVETEAGEAKNTDELSRGTAEQLYLALRFGLIEEFARKAESLPVVMDDILVNFDPDRASRAVASIRDLATRHQVIYFTCHPRAAELLDPDGSRTVTLD